ncbi:hypothetical protein GLYMA_02G221800v4 [Glycine max]|uniref:Uncharacterized protein n=2 Tax=Glycine subgen. Soja TaxID=1462606 RepID=K7KA41_SOYBN|nr:hypothetical protein JHK87_004903 [Glycine soja]KRH72591.1 hypothetical protein GLYMA_02G221800v4 [Glycine max]RZC26196.1 hypothetical protein D0Y65_004727 [Glycine soja]
MWELQVSRSKFKSSGLSNKILSLFLDCWTKTQLEIIHVGKKTWARMCTPIKLGYIHASLYVSFGSEHIMCPFDRNKICLDQKTHTSYMNAS